MERPFNVYFLPDLENMWHWLIYDLDGEPVLQSSQGHFHLIDAQKEAEAILSYAIAS